MTYRSRSATVAFAIACVVSVLGCSEEPRVDASDQGPSEPGGAVGLSLEIAPGVAIDTISYQLTGSDFTRSGLLMASRGGTQFSATFENIPPGEGLVLALRADAEGDAGLACAGQATFDVVAYQVTQVGVLFSCAWLDQGAADGGAGESDACPTVTATTCSPATQEVGGTIAVSVSARDMDRAPRPLSYAWTTSRGSLRRADTPGPSLLCTQKGAVELTYTIRGGACVKTGSLHATCGDSLDAHVRDAGTASDAGRVDAASAAATGNPANVVINELASSGGNPGDWIELYNKGAQPVDISSWVVRGSQDDRSFVLPAGTTLLPGGYYVAFVDALFGLAQAGSARLYTSGAALLLDSYSWTTRASGSYGRCPNGLGAFVGAASTRGAQNACGTGNDDAGADAGSRQKSTTLAGPSDQAEAASD